MLPVLGALFRLNATLAYFFSFIFNGITFIVSAIFMWKLPNILPERTTEAKHPLREALDALGVGAIESSFLPISRLTA